MLPRTVDRVRSARRIAAVASVAILAIAVPFLAVAVVAPTPARGATHAVDAGDGFFSPASLTVQVGDTVTWTNVDDSPHTVTGDGFDSGNMDAGATFSVTFTEAGTFDYVCVYHDGMAGSITVAEAPAAPAASASTAPSSSQGAGAQGGGQGGEQPNTALPLPESGSSWTWVAAVLIGVGLVVLALGFVPERGAVAAPRGRTRGRSGGWRR